MQFKINSKHKTNMSTHFGLIVGGQRNAGADVASGGSSDMASRGSGEHKKYGCKAAKLEWDVYDDDTQKTKPGWENVPQPWSAKTAMQYVGFPHFDRLWPRPCQKRHCKSISASYIQLADVETKWRFLTILRNISNLERWPKSAILKSMACMMYADHVLRVRVEWSSQGAQNAQKFEVLELHSLSV